MCFNPLPHMPILGSSNSAASNDVMSKIWTNGDTIIWLSRKNCWKRRNCSLRPISPFPTMFSEAVYFSCVKMSIYRVKGLLFLLYANDSAFVAPLTTRASQSSTYTPEGACQWNVLKLHPPILVNRTVLFRKAGLWIVWNIMELLQIWKKGPK